MKSFFVAALILPLQLITTTGTAQKKTTVPFSKISGYRPRLNPYPGAGYTTQLFARKEQFDLNFEKIPGTSGVINPNFSRHVVLSCYGEKTRTETILTLEKIEKENGILKVFFKAIAGKKIAKEIIPSCLYSTGIDRSLSGIDYYINGKLQQELRN